MWLTLIVILLVALSNARSSSADAGFFWTSNSLSYDTEFSYQFDVAVYPNGIFLDDQPHNYAYVTAENKHVRYNGIPYSVEAVAAYFNDNSQGGEMLFHQYADTTRYTNAWIDTDSDVNEGWHLSTLDNEGYLTTETNGIGKTLRFLRVQEQTIFLTENTNPVQSTWENIFYCYNFGAGRWDMKMRDTFIIPASRSDVSAATFQTGDGEWAGILETSGDPSDVDHGVPPVKDICYMNRSVMVVNQGTTLVSAIDSSINIWRAPNPPYQLLYLSQTNLDQFVVDWNGANPFITINPVNTLVSPGGIATLTVSAIGTPPLYYQWYQNGFPLAGATNMTYSTGSLSQSDSGNTFDAVVSNELSSMTSSVATLTVAMSEVIGWGSTNDGNITIPPTLNNATAIAAGLDCSMALKADGTVVVWGGDEYGQTNVPVGLANVTQISAGYYHCLALVNDGTVTAWGTDYWGICNVPLGLSQVVAVSAGGELSLALKADGTVVAWGDTNAMDGYPALVPKGLNNVISISAGQGHALALKSDGTVVAWGDNSYGESTVPPGLTNVTSVSAGNGFSIALKGDGTVVAWGDDTYEETDVPIGLTNIASISAGSSWCALALQDDGTPVTWGMAGTQTLDPPFNLQPVSEIEAGGYFALAIQVAQPLLSTGPPRQPKKIQKISFPNVSTKSYGVTFLLNATASSKLQVTYGVISGPATLSGVKVSTTGVGTVTLAADQLGNTKYAPANEVIRSFNVIKASQKISQFKTIPEKNTQSKPFSIILPTSSSGLPVSVTLKSGPATISGNTVTLNGVRGEVVLSANQLGNPDYIPAHEVSTSFVVKNH